VRVASLIRDTHTDMAGIVIRIMEHEEGDEVEIMWETGYISSRWRDDVRTINESR